MHELGLRPGTKKRCSRPKDANSATHEDERHPRASAGERHPALRAVFVPRASPTFTHNIAGAARKISAMASFFPLNVPRYPGPSTTPR